MGVHIFRCINVLVITSFNNFVEAMSITGVVANQNSTFLPRCVFTLSRVSARPLRVLRSDLPMMPHFLITSATTSSSTHLLLPAPQASLWNGAVLLSELHLRHIYFYHPAYESRTPQLDWESWQKEWGGTFALPHHAER